MFPHPRKRGNGCIIKFGVERSMLVQLKVLVLPRNMV